MSDCRRTRSDHRRISEDVDGKEERKNFEINKNNMKKGTLEHIKNKYNLPFLKVGMKVRLNIEPFEVGVIVSANQKGNLNVRYNGNSHFENTHPTKAITYFNKQKFK
jgi:hypothetical protein